MNKKLLLILMITFLGRAWLIAQDTIPDLIISEERLDWSSSSYIELTNMGDTALDLSNFILDEPLLGTNNATFYFKPGTILEPGKSFVLTNIWEEQDQNWFEMQKLADLLVYQAEEDIPGDSITPGYGIMQVFNGRFGTVLWYKYSEVDSMIIDCFSWSLDENGNTYKEHGGKPIAGVVEPLLTNTAIRKSHITQGNIGNWDASRGVDAADSEWLLAEHTSNFGLPFRTVGNHGDNYTIEVTSTNPDVVVDLANGTLTVPWGIYKGDSIIRDLNLGDGMAWLYLEKPVFKDSIHTVIQSGDILQVKSFGDQMTVKELLITVSEPKNDMNKVFPRRNVTLANPDDPGSIQVIGGTRYYVTKDMPVIDTIGNVPFATRLDTLYKYIEWASNASADIIWKDGSERVDLMNGDILEVTAANGAKKQYYIDVLEYTMSNNVNLTAITWPDITMDDMLFDYNWISDTLPGFSPSIYSYNVTLRYDTKNVPAFKAYSQDLNAKISYKPAVSLKGGFAERTTVITVTSESDSLSRDYSITFKIEERDDDKQVFKGEPFFTEFHTRVMTACEILEIVNPGNQTLDLSGYLIARGSGDASDAVTRTLDFANRYNMYVPGYRFTDDTAKWNNEDYKKLVQVDLNVDPTLEANGDVFVIGGGDCNRITDGTVLEPSVWNITFDNKVENRWGILFPTNTGLTARFYGLAFYLFRIDNDSILNGTKPIGDLEDLTLVDVLGHNDGRAFQLIGGFENSNPPRGHKVVRKSSIWNGNPSYQESGGTTPENSEWWWLNESLDKVGWDNQVATVGHHDLDPVTAYLSTVSSLVYLVDDGYKGDIGITGIGNGETVQQFIDNLILPDTGQDLTVKNNLDGAMKNPSDLIATGDTLVVTAADGKTITKYVLDITPLNNNVNLVALDGSALTIENGVVSGFDAGTTLESVLQGVKPESELSILNVLDATGAIIPLKVLDSKGDYQPVLATLDTWFEVVAQNGDRAKYQLKPNSSAGDAYVLSSVYDVNQEYMYISGVPGGTAVSSFITNLTVAEGATIKILDKGDYERTLGNLAYDDVLQVVSGDASKTVIYMLHFVGEKNTAPSVSVGATDIEAVAGVAIGISASSKDDGLPMPGELSYTWSVTSGTAANVSIATPNMATTDVTFAAEGSYVLQVTVSDGELSAVASVNATVTSTGIEKTNSSSFRMYPNPAGKSVTLEMVNRGNGIQIVSIYTITGKTVYKEITKNNVRVIDVSSLNAGLYFVKIETDTEKITKKLTIVR